MIKQVIGSIRSAAGHLWQSPRTMVLFLGFYLALLLVLYLFIVTREASLWQVVLTFFLGLVAPVLFFLIQALGVSPMLHQAQTGFVLRQSIRVFWRLIVVSLPLIGVACFILYLPSLKATSAPTPVHRPAPSIFEWPNTVSTTIRLILLYLVLPVAAIHLWIATVRQGLGATLGKLGHILLRAFAPASLLIYLSGLVLFGFLPYVLISTRTPAGNAWVEIGLLGLRLVLAFALFVLGWLITLRAMVIRNTEDGG